ncbi:MAG: hypothetical protein EXS14_05185 [Planctomycetes bacterium]|nr:hypothetical protein [Planctomycetota bacterium]
MPRRSLGLPTSIILCLLLLGCTGNQESTALVTVPERTAHRATALHAEVLAFLHAAAAQDRRQSVVSLGLSEEARDIAAVICADPPLRTLEAAARDPRSKVLIVGSIHPGECEGKEAILEVLRAFAAGEQDAWLQNLVLVFLPDYNPDGTDAVQALSREQQAGPADGCGRRETSKGFDLNRDFTKVEALETRALLLVLRTLDPLLTIDCHTTNGSYHGFDLTYAGPLSPATDPELQAHARNVFLPALRRALAVRGLLSFDYGNWRGNWWPDEQPRAWETFDYLPRYVTNGIGLRNRLSLLSEAYVHRPFAERIASTRALITEAVNYVARNRTTLVELMRSADQRAIALCGQGSVPLEASLGDSGRESIPTSGVTERLDVATGRRELHHNGHNTWVLSDTSVHFEGQLPVSVPWGFAISAPSSAVLRVLEAHGIQHYLLQHATQINAEDFAIRAVNRAPRPFQGHRLVKVDTITTPTSTQLPPGTLIIPTAQPLCRLVMLLCEPRSPDGFVAWEQVPVEMHAEKLTVNILRLRSAPLPRDKEK